jgi:hypothetical protein
LLWRNYLFPKQNKSPSQHDGKAQMHQLQTEYNSSETP